MEIKASSTNSTVSEMLIIYHHGLKKLLFCKSDTKVGVLTVIDVNMHMKHLYTLIKLFIQ